MAFFVLAQDEYKKSVEAASGMGKAVSMFKRTALEFEKAKSVVTQIPSNYQDNYNQKCADVAKMRDKSTNENKTIYFEREVPPESLPAPDAQNFVKLEPFEIQSKLAVEEKLRHIVPPQVRVMQTELQKKFEEVVNQMFEQNQKSEVQLKQFLTQYGLP